ncbi:MAG: hypothetical protein KTR16_15305, partial [Acidiferrobacterales bacterium]|nr:hypothetical protein [Acidiferrobacterales bacterium]
GVLTLLFSTTVFAQSNQSQTVAELAAYYGLLEIPMQFDVNDRGGIKNIQALTDTERKLVSKAKYELRKYPFRLAIVEGRLNDSQGYTYAVAVNLE